MSRFTLASLFASAAMAAACSSHTVQTAGPAAPTPVPSVDHHQHLFSPDIVTMLNSPAVQVVTAADLVAMLDSAGIRRANIMSIAYMYGRPGRNLADERQRVRQFHEWLSAEVGKYPDRLRAFCGVNPRSTYALEEIEYCARDPHLKHGLKLHFGNGDVQVDTAGHVEQLRRVFAAANRHRMTILVHMRVSISLKRPYGGEQARIFLEQVVPAARDVDVIVAHLAATGPGYDDPAGDSAAAWLADAARRKDPGTRRLWFDMSGIVRPDMPAAERELFVRRIRDIGIERIVYGSDAPTGGNFKPREAWATFRGVGLTEAEYARIARNVLGW